MRGMRTKDSASAAWYSHGMNEYQPRDGEVGPDAEALRLLRVPQLVIVSFAMGVGVFMAVTIVTGPTLYVPAGGFTGAQDRMFLLVGCVLISMAVTVGIVMRGSFVKPLRVRADAGDPPTRSEIMGRFQAWTILRGAFVEGPALLGVVTTFLTGNAIGLVLAGVCLLMFATVFPTYGRYAAFARDAGAVT